jgi:hypothetical protein
MVTSEAEWLACTDPQQMLDALPILLRCDDEQVGQGLSDRKLRLFACAVARLVRAPEPTVLNAERYADGEIELPVGEWIYWHRNAADAAADMIQYSLERHIAERRASPEQMAALLREIVGNLFRPVIRRPAVAPEDLDAELSLLEWRTPLVRSIARRAYDKRSGRKCKKCSGEGRVKANAAGGNRSESNSGLIWTGSGAGGLKSCNACHGTGHSNDGMLDPDTLTVLADALEDAGCDNQELLRHLRGWERCPDCCGTGRRPILGGPLLAASCRCDTPYGSPNRGWIKLRGPHVRGCHVLDLLLGKE